METVSDRVAAASLMERVQTYYNRCVASPVFRRWAAAFPLTRPIARRRARETFDLVAGFVYSQILYACVKVRLFDILAPAPMSAEALAERLALPLDSTLRLLDAAVALRLVARMSNQRYQLGALGAPLVGNTSITAMVEHHAMLYADLRDPVALLRKGARDTELARYWPYAANAGAEGVDAERFASYSRLMSASQPLVAEEILAAYPFGRHRCVMDVGGGDGTFLRFVAARTSTLKLMLFDLPPVAERGRALFAAQGLADRVTVHGGNFLTDTLPRGADLVTLIRVLHDHDDESVMRLLKSVRRVLNEGGTVLIAEPMSDIPDAAPVGDAYFGFYLLAMGRGRPRTPQRLAAMLTAAGFVRPEPIPTRIPVQTSLVRAVVHKPGH